ncbi:MAG: respiratory nitrate reductase subunit gamma [Dehalococcoidia bacterium]
MFLFQKCFYNNRALWYFTYPFHIGLFLLILWLILIFSGALMMIFGINFGESANISIKILNYVSLGVGILGIILGIFGCVGLIIKRSMDKKYKIYTTFRDYFSLLFIFAVLLNGLICWISYYPLNNVARQLMKSIITFSPGIILNASLSIGLILLSLLLFYLPFTPMMHFLGKYFTYHKVVWDNERKFKGTRLEGKLQKQLLQPISWAAPHAKPYKTWEEVIFDHKEIK